MDEKAREAAAADRNLERLQKPEDVLTFGLAEYLRGRGHGLWRSYVEVVDAKTGGVKYKGNAASRNHRFMALVLAAVETKDPAFLLAIESRLKMELDEGEFGKGEPGSPKYELWTLGSLALLFADLAPGHPLRLLILRFHRAWMAFTALGATWYPSTYSRGWGGCTCAAASVRSDPGHLVGDPRAKALWDAVAGGAPVHDLYRERAAAREARALADPPRFEEKAAYLEWRKLVSETWPFQALREAARRGLALGDDDEIALQGWMQQGNPMYLFQIGDMLCKPPSPYPSVRFGYTFHFLRWGSGELASWLEDSLKERCVFGGTYREKGAIKLLFPYDPGRRNSRGGTCRREGSRLVAVSPDGGQASLELPPGPPATHVVFGPEGLTMGQEP